MIQSITTGVTSAIAMGGQVVSAIFGTGDTATWSAVQPVIGLQIGMGVIGFVIAKIKSVTYGF